MHLAGLIMDKDNNNNKYADYLPLLRLLSVISLVKVTGMDEPITPLVQ